MMVFLAENISDRGAVSTLACATPGCAVLGTGLCVDAVGFPTTGEGDDDAPGENGLTGEGVPPLVTAEPGLPAAGT
jgi:hypothetical protein